MRVIAKTVFAGVAFVGTAWPCQAAEANTICFSSSDRGALCQVNGSWKAFSKASGTIPSDRIFGLAACGGSIVALFEADILRLEGDAWVPVARDPVAKRRVPRFACGDDSSLWIADHKSISHFKNSRWTTTPTAEIAPVMQEPSVWALGADRKGHAWMLLMGNPRGRIGIRGGGHMVTGYDTMLARWDGSGWNTLSAESEDWRERLLQNLFVDRSGRAWAGYVGGLYVTDGASPRRVPRNARDGAPMVLAEGDDGSMLASALAGDVLQRLQGDTWAELPRPEGRINALAVDSEKVVWAATNFGIARFASGKWTGVRMQTAALTDDEWRFVAVVGAGGNLPPITPRGNGAVAGRLTDESGKPLANRAVVICAPQLPGGPNRGPGGDCFLSMLMARAQTDADGRFAFRDLAPSRWSIHYQSRADEPGFAGHSGPSVVVEAAKTIDVGTIVYRER